MHPRRLDVVQAGHGARQLAFQAAAVVGGFHELAGAEGLLLVEDLEADVVVGGCHAGAGDLHARAAEIVGPDQQRAGIRFDLVGDVGNGQRLDHAVGVDTVEAAIERLVVRLLRPEHDAETDGDARRQPDQQADLAQHRQVREVLEERQSDQRLLRQVRAQFGGYPAVYGFSHESLVPAAHTGICMMSW
ncbi:hypothetical protein D9M71_397960 [compost metagenome]